MNRHIDPKTLFESCALSLRNDLPLIPPHLEEQCKEVWRKNPKFPMIQVCEDESPVIFRRITGDENAIEKNYWAWFGEYKSLILYDSGIIERTDNTPYRKTA